MDFLPLIITLVVLLALQVKSYRILGVFPSPAKSHNIIAQALMKGLANDGHDVTIVTSFLHGKPIANYTEIFLERSVDDAKKGVSANNFLDYNNLHFWDIAKVTYDVGILWTKSAFESENFQKFLEKKERFDVVIVAVFQPDICLGLGHYFDAPLIALSSLGSSKWTNDLDGSPSFPSFVPFSSNGYTDRMNFWQRMYNSLSFWYEEIAMPLIFSPKQQEMLEKFFPFNSKIPSFEELKRNVSLVLLNTHVTLGTPRPYAPNVIEVGGLQISQKTNPLPKHIQKFLDEAKDGAIFFSLGSNVKLSKIPDDKKAAIANAFSEYPNVRIVLKNEEQFFIPSHKAKDILVEQWFDQHSILAHPNIKVFITHGGLLSTTETVHFGKPIIGIPIFFDQYLNMRLAEAKGYGINVPFESLNQNALKFAIRKMFTNSSYAKQASIISSRFHDQLKTPLETAIHWVKHVAKNKGAPHMRMAAIDLPIYQLYNLDIYAFIVVFVILVPLIALKICLNIFRILNMNLKKQKIQ